VQGISKSWIIKISIETEHFLSLSTLMKIYIGHMKFENTKPNEAGFELKTE
jgi:hypothetical protein